MKCQYCKRFAKGIREPAKPNGDHYRLCPKRQKLVLGDDEWCSKFRLSDLYYCDTFNIWVSLDQCEFRMHNEELVIPECEACRQHSDLLCLSNWRDVREAKKKKKKKTNNRTLKTRSADKPKSKRTLKKRSTDKPKQERTLKKDKPKRSLKRRTKK